MMFIVGYNNVMIIEYIIDCFNCINYFSFDSYGYDYVGVVYE